MNVEAGDAKRVVEWVSAGQALENESGDLGVVAPFECGALVAAIDGLGHGPEAAKAAKAAAEILKAHASEPVVALVQKCHEGLRNTRGAVMTLASFDARASSLTWIGVGNVEGVLLRENSETGVQQQSVTTRGGVVGFQLPPLRPATLAVSPGDILILTTDGIRKSFIVEVTKRDNLQDTANSILACHSTQSDDALVVIARYLGRSEIGTEG